MTAADKRRMADEVADSIIRHCEAYGTPAREFILNALTELEAAAIEECEKVCRDEADMWRDYRKTANPGASDKVLLIYETKDQQSTRCADAIAKLREGK